MRIANKILSSRLSEMRRKRNKRFFTLGFIAGGAVIVFVSKLYGKFKCKKCVKRLISEKR